VDREDREEARAQGDEHVRPDAGRVAVDLALASDQGSQRRCEDEAKREVKLEGEVDHC